MDTSELQGLTVKELQKFAGDLGSTDFSGLRKQDLIKEILGIQAKKRGNIFASGVLEVLPDGMAFYDLRITAIFPDLMIFMYLIPKLSDLNCGQVIKFPVRFGRPKTTNVSLPF